MCGNVKHDERGWHVDEAGNPLPEEAPIDVTKEFAPTPAEVPVEAEVEA